MDVALDMSLDDMIKNSNSERFRGRGRGFRRGRSPRGSFTAGGRIADPIRRGPLRVNARPSSYNFSQSFRRTKNFSWRNEFLDDSLKAVGMPGIENGAKLYISNLEQGVSNDDIRELFSEIGELRRYAVHFDRNGRQCGSAEVVYSRRSDAFAAHRRYNNVQLDGKPMKLEIAGAKTEAPPVSARVNVIGGINGRRMVAMPGMVPRRVAPVAMNRGAPMVRGRGRGGGWGRGRGMLGGRGRGMGWGRGRRQQPQGGGVKSLDELNKDLEKYQADAMRTD